jgi:hypothetical protein
MLLSELMSYTKLNVFCCTCSSARKWQSFTSIIKTPGPHPMRPVTFGFFRNHKIGFKAFIPINIVYWKSDSNENLVTLSELHKKSLFRNSKPGVVPKKCYRNFIEMSSKHFYYAGPKHDKTTQKNEMKNHVELGFWLQFYHKYISHKNQLHINSMRHRWA